MKEKYLIVIDMQNDFVSGALGSPRAQEMAGNLVKLVSEFAGRVIFTQDTHYEDYMEKREGRFLPVPHCIEGTPGWELIAPLKELCEAKGYDIYQKNTFGSTKLVEDIKEAYEAGQVDSILFCGVCTDICVVSNALMLKAALPEADIAVRGDLCAGVTPEKHEAALDVMASCQIVIQGEEA